VRRPVRINFLWYSVGNLKVLIPATDGELEETPPGSTHAAELFWILPDGGAHSRRLTQREWSSTSCFGSWNTPIFRRKGDAPIFLGIGADQPRADAH
jgi:hypothetical protein